LATVAAVTFFGKKINNHFNAANNQLPNN
jgi:hypothetical protein